MISFSNLGRMGNLGNQLFQIASMHGIAKKLNTQVCFPQWKYQKYFKTQFLKGGRKGRDLNEPHFHYSDTWLEDNRDYVGWLQSEKYFDNAKELLEFEPTFKELVKAKYSKQLSKETICISVRRGDFVGNPNYELLPAKYYIGALLKFDYEKYNILFFSDDISYCKLHFECLNPYFIEADPIEQLCLMSLCDNHIISNSTFSWWGAYLSNSKRIIRPCYNFSEFYQKKNNDKDYYPNWESFDHYDYWIDLKDVTFTIPVQYDHTDRIENLNLNLRKLREDFNTNVLIGVNGANKFGVDCVQFNLPTFHRTKILNELFELSETPIVVNWDADMICPPMMLYLAAKRIRGGSDVVYPYDGRFARVPRKHYAELLKYDVGILSKHTFKGTQEHETLSVGGAIFFNKHSFFEGGGENEFMINYAPEDLERYFRFTTLGYKVERIKGVIFHVDHHINHNLSGVTNPYFKNNHVLWDEIKLMTKEQLREYVDSSLQKPKTALRDIH